MNWDRIKGHWKQLKGSARQRWGRLTEDYVAVVAGKREQMLGQVQVAYGATKDANEKRLAEWRARQHEVDPIHK